MFRFIHSSDLHLGKPFGRFPEDVRVRLRQARGEALRTLAMLAREHAASHILLAGDTFDQMTPARPVIRQALNTMAEFPDVTWIILPGNHDHANATELWRLVTRDAPANVHGILQPMPVPLSPDVTLLPAPPTERRPGRDLTDWFDDADTGEALRVGLAHGSIRTFTATQQASAPVLSPDRARDAGLAYLGLGDWHGQLQVTENTWYSGAPEADSFKHEATPSALLVTLDGRAPAVVTSVPTAQIHWRAPALSVLGAEADLDPLLPPVADRARTLLSLHVSGHARPAIRAGLEAAIAQVTPDFLWANADLSDLRLVHEVSDLDQIDRQGALRAAADALASEARDQARSPEDRATAQAALSYLFTYAGER